MQNQSRTVLKYIIVMLTTLIVYNVSADSNRHLIKNAKLYQVSKRHLISKEREYLKSNPLSKELRSFIQRYKRKTNHYNKKREEDKQLDKENMYVVKDGDILPISEVDASGREDNDVKFTHADDDDKFTVLPLIVPVTVSRERISTCSDEFLVPTIGATTEKICTEDAVRRLGRLREISTTIGMEEDTTSITSPSNTPIMTTSTAIATTKPLTTTTTTTTTPTSTTTTITTTTIATTPISTSSSNPSTSTSNKGELTTLSSIPVNTKLLNRVYEDIKELMGAQEDIPKGIESSICNVNGDWDSAAGGMQIRIAVRNDTKHPDVGLVEKDPPADEGLFKEGNWSLSAFVPYSKSSSILVLNAHTFKGKKFVAVFVGECRICENEEAISGHWLIQRQSTDCSDREVSHKFISEVLKKNNVRKLQQERLNSIVSATVPM